MNIRSDILIIHVVAPNETIYSIARHYGVPQSRIINDNELTDPNRLAVGQTIVIMMPKIEHLVVVGDTLESIAEQYGITVNQIFRNNPILGGNPDIYEGQVLVIEYDTTKNGSINVSGYAYPFINRDLLRKTLPYLTYLNIFSYTFNNNGELIEIDDIEGVDEMIELAIEYDVAPMMTLTTLNEEGLFSGELAHSLLIDENKQNLLISQVLEELEERRFFGLDLDFEFIYAEDKERFSAFVDKTTTTLNNKGFIVTVAVAPKISENQPGLLYEGHDYEALGEAANELLIMTYEWGYAYGIPMAVAPINDVRRVLEYGSSVIPKEKMNMGIPNYGYDWQLPHQMGVPARSIGNVEAVDQAINRNAEIMFDGTSQAPYYNYYVDNNQHVVWFEDARSIEAKLQLANELEIGGVGYWNLMRYFPQNWLILNSMFDINKV